MNIYDMKVVEVSWLPKDRALFIDGAALRGIFDRQWRALADAFPPNPSPLDIIWRDCRRQIASACPLTSPPEWAGLPDLRPERFPFTDRTRWMHSRLDRMLLPGTRILDMRV